MFWCEKCGHYDFHFSLENYELTLCIGQTIIIFILGLLLSNCGNGGWYASKSLDDHRTWSGNIKVKVISEVVGALELHFSLDSQNPRQICKPFLLFSFFIAVVTKGRLWVSIILYNFIFLLTAPFSSLKRKREDNVKDCWLTPNTAHA